MSWRQALGLFGLVIAGILAAVLVIYLITRPEMWGRDPDMCCAQFHEAK